MAPTSAETSRIID